MRTSLRRSLAVTAGATALLGGAVVLPGLADAQAAEPTFTALPTTVSAGDTVTFTATLCVSEGVSQDLLYVQFFEEGGGAGPQVPTDGTGTAVLQLPVSEVEPGTFTFSAICYSAEGETQTEVFTYAQTPTVTVAGATTTTATPTTTAPTSSTTAPTSATTAPGGVAGTGTVRPAFTG